MKKLSPNRVTFAYSVRQIQLLAWVDLKPTFLPKKRQKIQDFVCHFQNIIQNLICSLLLQSRARVADLHAAFADDSVDAILATIGGFNSNELLPYIDYDLIAKHPKIICGYSDSTAFLNAIFAKTGNLTYMGPSYSSFKMKEGQDYQIKAWLNAMTKSAYDLVPSQEWFKRPLV